MHGLLDIYRTHFKTSLALELQYRVAAVIWQIGTVVQPLVYLVVWTQVARASGGSAGGYTEADFAAYFIAMMVVDHLTFMWHMWEYDYRIREGLLSPMLLRPLHPIHTDVAENLAHKVVTLSVILPAALLMTLLFRPALDPPLWALLSFFPVVLLAAAVRFLTGWATAMAAFWTTRIAAINQMYYVAEFFFSGRLAPLTLLPAALQLAAAILPFRWTLAFPVELLLGRVTPRATLQGIGVQLVWLILSLLVIKLLWRAAVKQYTAVGG